MSNIPKNDLGISLLQHTPTPGNVSAGLNRLEQAAQESADQGSSLLLSPECGVTGYNLSLPDAQSVAIASDGAEADQIARTAQQHGIAILYGYIERENNQLYNSVQLLDDNGKPILHYRKTHLWGDLDKQLFKAGDQLAPIVSYKGWYLSTLICYDVEFPETVRSLALAGAQLVLVPTALMTPFRFVAQNMVPVRAAENQLFLAYANLAGRESNTLYEGCSTIADPEGTVLVSAPSDNDALLHCVLKASTISAIRKALPYHQDRRPELYRTLVQ